MGGGDLPIQNNPQKKSISLNPPPPSPSMLKKQNLHFSIYRALKKLGSPPPKGGSGSTTGQRPFFDYRVIPLTLHLSSVAKKGGRTKI